MRSETITQTDAALGALNAYFLTDPLRQWFGAYKFILQPLKADFWPESVNTAIHTDICSPVATDPPWSQLPEVVRRTLFESGQTLWRALIEVLRPDILIAPVNSRYLASLDPQPVSDWPTLYVRDGLDRKARAKFVNLGNNRSCLAVHGPAFNLPFLPFNREDKLEIGRRILKMAESG
jgi:hypothetical protein